MAEPLLRTSAIAAARSDGSSTLCAFDITDFSAFFVSLSLISFIPIRIEAAPPAGASTAEPNISPSSASTAADVTSFGSLALSISAWKGANDSVIVPLSVEIFAFFIGLTPSPTKERKTNLTARVASICS